MFANARVLISRRHIVRMRMIIIHQQPHHLADKGGHSGSRAGLVRYVFLKFLKFQFKNKTNKKRKIKTLNLNFLLPYLCAKILEILINEMYYKIEKHESNRFVVFEIFKFNICHQKWNEWWRPLISRLPYVLPTKNKCFKKKNLTQFAILFYCIQKLYFIFYYFKHTWEKSAPLFQIKKKKTNTRSYSYELLTTNTHENVLCSYCRLSLGAVIPLRFIVDVLLPLQFSLSIGKVELNSL